MTENMWVMDTGLCINLKSFHKWIQSFAAWPNSTEKHNKYYTQKKGEAKWALMLLFSHFHTLWALGEKVLFICFFHLAALASMNGVISGYYCRFVSQLASEADSPHTHTATEKHKHTENHRGSQHKGTMSKHFLNHYTINALCQMLKTTSIAVTLVSNSSFMPLLILQTRCVLISSLTK